MITLKILLLTLFLAGCTIASKDPSSTVEIQLNKNSDGIFIADYSDFGPPQLTKELLGDKWWQWDDPENYKPVAYDVKVVVYRNIDIEAVKQAFPVVPNLKQDYRYIKYKDAAEYFSNKLSEFEKEMRTYDNPSDLGSMCVFPLELYKTALAMEKKLLK